MKKVIVLEPNRVLARQYVLALGAAGFDVHWASDGHMAVFTADKNTPQVIVMELLIAGHSGIEFLYEFKTYKDWQAIPIVILSMIPPHEISGTPQALAALGVTHYLYKPHTTLKHLQNVVEAASKSLDMSVNSLDAPGTALCRSVSATSAYAK